MTTGTPYRTVQVSLIPVEQRAEGYVSIPLWTTDLNASASLPGHVHLVCPVHPLNEGGLKPVAAGIDITDAARVPPSALDQVVAQADVVEVPGNFGWRDAALSRRVMGLAKRHGTLCILGISSNRAKTVLLNAQQAGPLRRLRARLKAWDIGLTQRYMARRCDGVRVVGRGLVPLIEAQATSIHVETASWISAQDFDVARAQEHAPARVVMAARFEHMKGIDIGVRAVADVVAGGAPVALRVIGQGPEEGALKQLVAELDLSDITEFAGQLAYPDAFFEAMGVADFVLLTNRNDEQPRLIFDAISRGAIPICPRSETYVQLGLDESLLYTQGSAEELQQVLGRLISLDGPARGALRASLAALAQTYTLERMHSARRDWVLSLLQGRRAGVLTQMWAKSRSRSRAPLGTRLCCPHGAGSHSRPVTGR